MHKAKYTHMNTLNYWCKGMCVRSVCPTKRVCGICTPQRVTFCTFSENDHERCVACIYMQPNLQYIYRCVCMRVSVWVPKAAQQRNAPARWGAMSCVHERQVNNWQRACCYCWCIHCCCCCCYSLARSRQHHDHKIWNVSEAPTHN